MARKPSKSPNLYSVTTINDDGSRNFLHPSDVSGFYTLCRRWVGVFLIATFVALPWIPINGYPAVFLDVVQRRFHLFGLTFAAQDMWFMYFLITGLAFTLFFMTSLLGRVWCGWACPQTVYLDVVYRRIERWIEGDAVKRRKLDRQPWNREKILKRGSKHILFYIASILIMHIFLSYFVSLPELWKMMQSSPAEHWGSFGFVFIASTALYFNFAWFREQLCIVICPYGRLQSVLIDEHSINIGYDESRGEPRGKPTNTEAGDCINCKRCVQVCPTGIDIRQGVQMECIGCANCIDACNSVMTRLGRPKGLIRYDSEAQFEGRKTKFIRPRILFYILMACVGTLIASIAFFNITPVEATITRMRGLPSYVTETAIRNQYQIRLINKTNDPTQFEIKPGKALPGLSSPAFSQSFVVPPMREETRPLIVLMNRQFYKGPFDLEIEISVKTKDTKIEKEVKFLGPNPRVLNKQRP